MQRPEFVESRILNAEFLWWQFTNIDDDDDGDDYHVDDYHVDDYDDYHVDDYDDDGKGYLETKTFKGYPKLLYTWRRTICFDFYCPLRLFWLQLFCTFGFYCLRECFDYDKTEGSEINITMRPCQREN